MTFVDAESMEAGAVVEADVVVVGAGAAGVTLAKQFIGTGTTVAVLVGGGMTADGKSQALSDGVSEGNRYFAPVAAAVRCLGGNTTHWGSWIRPFDESDFVKRDWVPHSGWPLAKADLDPYYARSYGLLGVEDAFDPASLRPAAGGLPLRTVDTPGGDVVTKIWRFHKPPVCFGRDHEAELRDAKNLTFYLNAHLTSFHLSEGRGAVTGVTASTLGGRSLRFGAKRFVLAAGGVQTPRLLLACDAPGGPGVGNDRDLVGRYFMDHPHFHRNGLLVLKDVDLYPHLYDTNTQYSEKVVGGFCPTADFQSRARIMNCAVNFKPSIRTVKDDEDATWGDAVSTLLDNVTYYPGKVYRRVRKALGYRNDTVPPRRFLDVITRCEQAPNPESRIGLVDDRDSLGVRKVKIDWRVTGLDKRTMLEVHRSLAAAVGAAGLGRFRVELKPETPDDAAPWDTTGEEGRFEGGWHHMGATRMSDDPASGVVDRNCKVHGTDNLYVAGSSVFPTSSAFNPTLTIVAMTIRLADYLKAGHPKAV